MSEVAGRIRGSLVEANGTRLYCEVRGYGPPVLMIMGAFGDAGSFRYVAEALCDEFEVISYDRRGNSRSPRPAGWSRTSIAEQAGDAAALVEALGVAPAVVFGTSGGGTILLELIRRRADLVRGALVHEPALMAVSPSRAEAGREVQRMVTEGRASGGHPAAEERFARWVCTDGVFEAMDRDVRERMLDPSEVFLDIELEMFLSYLPDAEAIRGTGVPIVVAAGEETRGMFLAEGAEWLARQLGCGVRFLPGYHTPYWHPRQSRPFAESLRPRFRELAA
jgi:pimeloyl-ACP methyl ester carboxylesterase